MKKSASKKINQLATTALPTPLPPDIKSEIIIENSLNDLMTNLAAYGTGQTAILSETTTLYKNLRNYLLSNNRQLLSQLYVEHGIIQTLIDQPIDDAFKGQLEIQTSQLDEEEVKELNKYLEEKGVLKTFKQAMKWARLFGGGGVLIITPQDPETPLDIEAIGEDTPIIFRACDMWELYNTSQTIEGTIDIYDLIEKPYYTYYGKRIHPSRVIRLQGKEAPSMVRPRLLGWGMSEAERLVRSVNQYFKNQDVTFELLDEAKVDVWKIKNFNSGLANKNGTSTVTNRIQSANLIKNYTNAVTMDIEDDYQQKQITFSGLSEVIKQIRESLASDVRMPLTKLFGISSSGFNSGDDDIENYNSMIESEIRSQCKGSFLEILKICCQKLFNFIPDDLWFEFPTLRILSAEQQETVKEKQFNRVFQAWSSGFIETEEAKEMVNRGSLLPMKIDPTLDASDPKGFNIDGDDEENPKDKKQKPKGDKK
jgi:phage-related protein (TIGR01555 family)